MRHPRHPCLLAATMLMLAIAMPRSAPGQPPATFPVSLSADGRTLVDATGAPFPILGRTAWFITSLPQADYQTFLDDTAAKGYTAIEFHVINHDPRGNHPPFGGNGALPFLTRLGGGNWDGTGAPDFTTPNEAYWAHADAILAYAESRGMLAFMFPAYAGYGGGEQGWMQELVANGPTRIHTYGAWIASRYASRGNIVWMMGGDMSNFNAQQLPVEQALFDGLRSVPDQQSTFFSAEWDSGTIATSQPEFGAAMSLNGGYSWEGYSAHYGLEGYRHTPVEPAFLLEEPYDEEGPDGDNANGNATQPVRRFQWWGWLGAIGGYISGNGYIWPFNPGWQDHLNTQGARDMVRLNAFIRSFQWQDLVPSGLGGTADFVVNNSIDAAHDFVAAAATHDGTLLIAYIPPAHSGDVTIDMTRLSGPARARWFNPTTAVYSPIATQLPNTGTHSFSPPGDNGTGFTDWVLVLNTCDADFNGDGAVNSNDFFDFVDAFFATDAAADFNHDGQINSQDYFDFLTAFFAGC